MAEFLRSTPASHWVAVELAADPQEGGRSPLGRGCTPLGLHPPACASAASRAVSRCAPPTLRPCGPEGESLRATLTLERSFPAERVEERWRDRSGKLLGRVVAFGENMDRYSSTDICLASNILRIEPDESSSASTIRW